MEQYIRLFAKPVELDKVLATIRLQLSRKNNADGRQG